MVNPNRISGGAMPGTAASQPAAEQPQDATDKPARQSSRLGAEHNTDGELENASHSDPARAQGRDHFQGPAARQSRSPAATAGLGLATPGLAKPDPARLFGRESRGSEGEQLGPLRSKVTPEMERPPVAVREGEQLQDVVARVYGIDNPSERFLTLLSRMNGLDASEPLPRTLKLPAKRNLFMTLHPIEQRAPRAALADAELRVSRAGETWGDVVEDYLGRQPDPGQREAVAALLASFNNVSLWEPLPPVVALPQAGDLRDALDAVQRNARHRDSEGRPQAQLPRDNVSNFTGNPQQVAEMPTPGKAYAPQWSDNMRGVLLHAYRHELAELPPEQAQQQLERLMLTVMWLNEAPGPDVRTMETLFIPTWSEATDLVEAAWTSPEFRNRLGSNSERAWLLAVEGQGEFAAADARALISGQQSSAQSVSAADLTAASSAVSILEAAEIDRRAGELDMPGWISWSLAMGMYRAERQHHDTVDLGIDEAAAEFMDAHLAGLNATQRAVASTFLQDILAVREALKEANLIAEDGSIEISVRQGETRKEALVRIVNSLDGVSAAQAETFLLYAARAWGDGDQSRALTLDDIAAAFAASARGALLGGEIHSECEARIRKLAQSYPQTQAFDWGWLDFEEGWFDDLVANLELRVLDEVRPSRASFGREQIEALRERVNARAADIVELHREAENYKEKLQRESAILVNQIVEEMNEEQDTGRP